MGRGNIHIGLILLYLTIPFFVSGQSRPNYEVERLSVSSGVFSDIAPVIVADGIIFCSTRKSSIVKDYSTYDGNRLYDIYFAEKSPDGKFKNPRMFSKELNTVFNEGPLCFSADGKTLFFTRNIESGKNVRKKNRPNTTGIFTAEKQGESWVNVRPFEHNNPSYNIGHPSLSTDGKMMFFASDKPGGRGGFDIYYCELVNNKWSLPINAGDKINTPQNEGYPYMHSSGRLYFSSTRPPNRKGDFGSQDIYYSVLYYGEWSDPILLGEPINSSYDDFAFSAYPDGQSGYFTSSRKRNDNIYGFTSVIIRKESCNPLEINEFCYEFYEVNAVQFDTIPFQYEWDFGDGTKTLGARAKHCFAGPGTYIVRLNALDLVTRKIQFNEATYELEISLVEQPYITAPDTCRVGEQVAFDSKETNLPGWTIGRYYWNFGDESAEEGATVMKVFNLPGVYDVQLIVSTEPDRDGVVKEGCVSKRIVVLGNR
jgi:hypothetical protein